MAASRATKICPVCDSAIPVGARTCPQCNTDLSLFDVEGDGVLDTQGPVKGGKSIDDILESIVGGKDVRPDIFEDIKTIAKNGKAEEDILAEEKPSGDVQFECPNCGARVASSATSCPKCGVKFAEEAVEQFECPLCSSVVEVSATECPNCGVKFEQEAAPPAAPPTPAPEMQKPAPELVTPPVRPEPEPEAAPKAEELELEEVTPTGVGKSPMERLWAVVESRRARPEEEYLDRASLYRALPKLVSEVKPLLLTARKIDVDISKEKQLISEAIALGKRQNVEQAVALIQQARFQLDESFTTQVARRIEELLLEAERTRQTGADVGAVLTLCTTAIEALEAKDYSAAGESLRAAREEYEARAGGYARAREELATVQEVLQDAKKLGLNLREAEAFVARGQAAMAARSWDQAAGLAVQARQSLTKVLPELLAQEMRRGRNMLLEIKVRGGDLTKPVGILKQASIHMKREEYAEAVRFIRRFQEEVGTVKK